MAVDAIEEGKHGLMTAIEAVASPWRDSRSETRPAPVDVATMYNTERYRPTYDGKLGLPIFLIRA